MVIASCCGDLPPTPLILLSEHPQCTLNKDTPLCSTLFNSLQGPLYGTLSLNIPSKLVHRCANKETMDNFMAPVVLPPTLPFSQDTPHEGGEGSTRVPVFYVATIESVQVRGVSRCVCVCVTACCDCVCGGGRGACLCA